MKKINRRQEILIVTAAVLVVVILGLLIWAIQAKKISPKAATTATLALNPSSGNIVVNQTMSINVVLNTGGNLTDGTDIMIQYNPAYFDIVDQNAGVAGVQIGTGTIYPTYLNNVVDTVNGIIKVSGIIGPTDPGYNGTGTFATIVARAKVVVASATMNFNFVAGTTSDNTNVIEHTTGNDVLLSVTNGNYALVANAPTAPNLTAATPTFSQISLTWVASTAGTYPIAGYSVYRGTSAGGQSPTPIANVGSAATTYIDTAVTHGVTYYYIVKAYDNQTPANYSGPSNERSATLSPANITINLTLQKKTNYTTTGSTLKVYAAGNTTTALATKTFDTSSAGTGTTTVNLDAGTYDFYVRANNYLSKKLTIAMTSSTTLSFGQLDAGDLNNDDVVNSADYTLMVSAWFSSDATADINADGVVNSADYSIMVANWFKAGTMPK